MNQNQHPGLAREFLLASGVLFQGAKVGAAGGVVLVKALAFVVLSCLLCLLLLGIPLMLVVMLFTGRVFGPLFHIAEYFVLAALCVMALARIGGHQALAFYNGVMQRPPARDASFNE